MYACRRNGLRCFDLDLHRASYGHHLELLAVPQQDLGGPGCEESQDSDESYDWQQGSLEGRFNKC